MFPDDAEEYLDSEDIAIETEETAVFNGTSFLYDFAKGDFIYRNGAPIKVTGIAALKVWIEKIIRTEKFKWGIYKDVDLGPQLEDLIGSNFPSGFIQSEIKREISDALLVNPYIDSIEDLTYELVDDRGTITFTVNSNGELFGMEVTGL